MQVGIKKSSDIGWVIMQSITRSSSDPSHDFKEPEAKRQCTKIENLALETLGEPDLNEMLAFFSAKKVERHSPETEVILNAELVFEEKRTGYFTVSYVNGETYKGDFIAGVPHGKGKFYHCNGHLHYKGEVHSGELTGRGKLFWPNGNLKYEGGIENHEFHGFGIYYDENGKLIHKGYWYKGSKYIGEIKDSVPNGYGDLYDKEGHLQYKGNWFNGVMHGEGIEFDDHGFRIRGQWYYGYRYVGEWKDGKPHGFGLMYYQRRKFLYRGYFFQGVFHGEGTLFMHEKVLFTGEFKQGIYHGTGKLYDFQGLLIKMGRWVKGQFVEPMILAGK
jgi:hypothetical protein